MSPRFDYVDESGIELRWDGKGPFQAGIRGRASGDFLYVDSFDAPYGQPPIEEDFVQLCRSYIRSGTTNTIPRPLRRTAHRPKS
jgi:hypothetical protein